MALKAVIEKLDDVAEGLRGEYRAGTKDEGLEGHFVLAVEPAQGFTLENVDGLKGALSKERGAREKAERAAEAFKDMDAAEVRKRLEKLADLEKLDPAKEADKLAEQKMQARIEQMNKAHETELQKAREAAEKFERGYKTRTMQSAVNAALAEADALNPEALKLKIERHLRLKDSGNPDDPFAVEVVGEDGNPMVDARGNNLGVKDFVDQLRADKVWAGSFKAAGKSGSGANPSSGGGKTMSRSQFEALDAAAKHETIKSGVSITD